MSDDCVTVIEHPCATYARLETEYQRRGYDGAAIKIKIGEEDTTLSLISLDNLRIMRNEYQAKCAMTGGCASPRQSICVEFGDHVCRTCQRTHCGC